MTEEHPPDWPKIVERHAERFFRIAYRIIGSVHDAKDVYQLVFIEPKRVQGPIQNWSTWQEDYASASAPVVGGKQAIVSSRCFQ